MEGDLFDELDVATGIDRGEAPLDLKQLRARYVELNKSFARQRIHQFGRGGGFCAEVIGLLKSMLTCLASETQLVVGTHPKGRGFSLGEGWGDYFMNLFPTKRTRISDLLNRHVYPANSYIPDRVSRMAHAATRRLLRADLLQFDPLRLPERLTVRELGVDLGWWDACKLCIDLMWEMRPEVAEAVARTRLGFRIEQPYIGLHVRRGDKRSESSYVPLEAYVRKIVEIANPPRTVVIASDDAAESERLAALMERSFDVRSLASASDRGYDQARFNALPARQRWERTVRFIAELEILRDAEVLLVTTSSNVGAFLQYARAGRGIINVE